MTRGLGPPGPTRVLWSCRSKARDLADRHFNGVVHSRERHGQSEFATHGLDVVAQRREIKIGLILDPADLRLRHPHLRCDLLLGQHVRTTKFGKSMGVVGELQLKILLSLFKARSVFRGP
jgi:hypothetical protein